MRQHSSKILLKIKKTGLLQSRYTTPKAAPKKQKQSDIDKVIEDEFGGIKVSKTNFCFTFFGNTIVRDSIVVVIYG